jgi:hypothetical protein
MRVKSWTHESQKIDWRRAEQVFGSRIDRRRAYWLYHGTVMIYPIYEEDDDREVRRWIGGERFSGPLVEYDGEAAIYHRAIAFWRATPERWKFYCESMKNPYGHQKDAANAR